MKSELLKTEESISFVKKHFEKQLCKSLKLTKVTAPLAVKEGTGVNDDLNGIEAPVSFGIKALGGQKAVVVHSLAKWKRLRIKELQVEEGKGILTNMSALRPDEDYSPIHSIFVDQWDWEKHIASEKRTLEYLKETVKTIYSALRKTEIKVSKKYSEFKPILPEEITFIHSEELLQLYPKFTVKERESLIAKKYGSVFIIGIGAKLSDGYKHDGRAADYDDWSTQNSDGYQGLNGDIIVWNQVLESGFEISSMGIRVDKLALMKQLFEAKCEEKAKLDFHRLILDEEIQESIGGGIGQSRVCMFLLRKQHIKEVQQSIWPESGKIENTELLKAV
jgi:aspartate--ammonia ligase